MRPLVSIFALASLALPSPTLAWGQTGHRVIGEIADDKVSGRTKAEIDLLLDGEDLAEISTWADEERSNPDEFWQQNAGPWHYVTVPEGSTYADTTPPTEGDAITALKQFAETLRDRDAEPDQRRLALHFIVHIVGDLHQPLHAGNGTDRGGNDELVQWYGQDTNLHAVWDTHLIENQKLSYLEYSKWLARQIAPDETLEWWVTDPEVWVQESTQIRDVIYPARSGDEVPNLRWSYQYKHLPTVERRLRQGGVRLAAYLDWVFSESK